MSQSDVSPSSIEGLPHVDLLLKAVEVAHTLLRARALAGTAEQVKTCEDSARVMYQSALRLLGHVDRDDAKRAECEAAVAGLATALNTTHP